MLENLEIEEMVEQAASFVSYKTVHTKSGRKYLLRRYLVDESTGLDQVENWQEEFLTLVSQFSKVKSPTLRSILGGGIDEQDENPYIIFEWLYANTLSNVIGRQGGLSAYDVVDMARAVLLGVSALHERKVVHAGINLHSVLYNETQEKYKWVLDWNPLVVLRTRNGLNRFMEDEFACPELLVTNEASEMSDLYAIGKVVDASIGSEDEKQFILRWLLKMTSRKSARRYQSVDTALPDLVNLNIPDDIVVEEVPQVIHPPVASIQKETVQKEIVIPEVEKVISASVQVTSLSAARRKEDEEDKAKHRKVIFWMSLMVLVLISAAIFMNFSKSKLGGETETAVTPTESSEVHEEEGLEEIGHIKN